MPQPHNLLDQPHNLLVKARWAVSSLFFVNGVVIATWASRVPAVQQHLGLSAGQLGLALLGMAVGAFPMMSLAAVLIKHYGSRGVARAAVLLLCLALPLPGLARSSLGLFGALTALGACSGFLNVAVNSQAATTEMRYGRPIMAVFHGLFSVGSLVGALMGAGMASLGVAPLVHLIVVACLLLVGVLFQFPYLLPTSETLAVTSPATQRPLRPLLGLTMIAFCTVLCEGAVADWSGVYLHKEIGTSASLAALGYAAFAAAMIIGRLTGDKLGERWGDKALVRGSALVGTAGLGFALVFGGIPLTLLGFACVGVGCACVFPTLVRVSARLPHISAEAAIAFVSTAGFMGFFIGPPLIGWAADYITLRCALGIVVVASGLIVLLAPIVQPSKVLSAAHVSIVLAESEQLIGEWK